MKHNCASLCNIVKTIYKDLIYQQNTGTNIRQSSFVFFGLKKYELMEHMCVSLEMLNGLGYCDLVYYK